MPFLTLEGVGNVDVPADITPDEMLDVAQRVYHRTDLLQQQAGARRQTALSRGVTDVVGGAQAVAQSFRDYALPTRVIPNAALGADKALGLLPQDTPDIDTLAAQAAPIIEQAGGQVGAGLANHAMMSQGIVPLPGTVAGKVQDIAQGLGQAAGDLAGWFATPEGLQVLASPELLAANPAMKDQVVRFLGALYAGQMGGQAKTLATQTFQAYNEGNTAEATRLGAQLALSLAAPTAVVARGMTESHANPQAQDWLNRPKTWEEVARQSAIERGEEPPPTTPDEPVANPAAQTPITIVPEPIDPNRETIEEPAEPTAEQTAPIPSQTAAGKEVAALKPAEPTAEQTAPIPSQTTAGKEVTEPPPAAAAQGIEEGASDFAPLPAVENPYAAPPVRPVVRPRAQEDYTLTDAVKEHGGVSAPPLDQVRQQLRKGKSAADIVADWAGDGGEHDALIPIIDELAEAQGNAAQARSLAERYRDLFTERDTPGKRDEETLMNMQRARDAGEPAPAAMPTSMDDLYRSAWEASALGDKVVDPEATAAAQADADISDFSRRLELNGDEITHGDTWLARRRTTAKGQPVWEFNAAEAPRLSPDQQNAVLVATQRADEARTKVVPPLPPTAREPEPGGVPVGEMGPGLGAAIPEEFAPTGGAPIGLKKSVIQAERLASVLPALETPLQPFKAVVGRVLEVMDRDPMFGPRLVQEFKAHPRAMDDADVATFLIHKRELVNLRQRLTRDLLQATEDAKTFANRALDAADLGKQMEGVQRQIDDVNEVFRTSSASTARGLAAHRWMMKDDYTLEALTFAKRAAVGGRELTEAEHARLKEAADKLTELQKRFDEMEAADKVNRDRLAVYDASSKAIAELTKEGWTKKAEKLLDYMANNAARARADLHRRFSQMNSGVPDPMILVDLAQIGAEKLVRGGLNVEQMVVKLAHEFGEKLVSLTPEDWKEVCRQAVNFAHEQKKRFNVGKVKFSKDLEGRRQKLLHDLAQEAIGRAKPEELGRLSLALLRNYVKSGIIDKEAAIDAVHAAVQDKTALKWSRADTLAALADAADREVRIRTEAQLKSLRARLTGQAKVANGRLSFPLRPETQRVKAELAAAKLQWQNQLLADKMTRAWKGSNGLDTTQASAIEGQFTKESNRPFTPKQRAAAERLANQSTAARSRLKRATAALNTELTRRFGGAAADVETTRAAVAANAGKLTPATCWAYARNYLDRGVTDFSDLVHHIATDIGLRAEDVRRTFLREPGIKRLLTEVARAQEQARVTDGNATAWLRKEQFPILARLGDKAQRIMFSVRVGFHGTVALGTHVPMMAFMPRLWGMYARSFLDMYHMVGSRRYFETMMDDMVHDPNFAVARRAGLSNNPLHADEYADPKLVEYFGGITKMGNRGYSVLKLIRQRLFDYHWNKLPETMRTERAAQDLADWANHITGTVRSRPVAGAHYLLFAPRLEMSRGAWLFGDTAKTVATLSQWRSATPEARLAAARDIKTKLTVATTYLGMLAANQGLLIAFGSKQRVNMTDPMQSDFLKFKGFGRTISYGNAMVTMARLIPRLIEIRNSDGGKLRNVVYPDESSYTVLGEYARSQASPVSSLVLDLFFKSDWMHRPLPNSNRPVPARLRAEGVTPYTWTEFWTQQALPIPAQEFAREVWDEFGVTGEEGRNASKALLTTLLMAGTGTRIVDDYKLKPQFHTPGQNKQAVYDAVRAQVHPNMTAAEMQALRATVVEGYQKGWITSSNQAGLNRVIRDTLRQKAAPPSTGR